MPSGDYESCTSSPQTPQTNSLRAIITTPIPSAIIFGPVLINPSCTHHSSLPEPHFNSEICLLQMAFMRYMRCHQFSTLKYVRKTNRHLTLSPQAIVSYHYRDKMNMMQKPPALQPTRGSEKVEGVSRFCGSCIGLGSLTRLASSPAKEELNYSFPLWSCMRTTCGGAGALL